MDRTVFLAEFEFISGEYVQTFYHTVIESSNKKALREIKRFLREYYGRGNCTEYDKHREVYYYFGGDVAIRFVRLHELTAQEIVDMLSIC